MNLKILLSCIFILIAFCSSAQQKHEVYGRVIDTAGVPLAGVNVKLTSTSDSLLTSTNTEGVFRFPEVNAMQFNIAAMLMGFQSYNQTYTIENKTSRIFALNPIKLKILYSELKEVTVSINPITIKEDTVEYSASAYKVQEGAPVEDMIKKLPGVTVDKEGNVTAEGKKISRVRVNGKDFFGGDVQTATQNLPADIIDNIQIIDDYGDQANLTGIKDGEPEKILNINIQRGKRKGTFGNGTLAGGNVSRYLARANVNNFNEERQISMIGSVNNTNANTFNFNGGGRGGAARGANFGSGERGGSGGNGITNSQSIGLNYRDNWGKKIVSYGSYSYSGRTNNTIGTSFRQDFNPLNIRTTGSNSDDNSNSSNHRLTWNLEYRIDSANYIKITPYFSAASSHNENAGLSEIRQPNYYTQRTNKSANNSTSPNAGSDLLYNYKFKKRGRNFSVNASLNYSNRNSDRDVNNTYFRVDSTFALPKDSTTYQYQSIGNENINNRTNIRTSYSEPLSKTSFLEFNYTWNKSDTRSIRDVNDIDPLNGEYTVNNRQSNDYSYQFITNRIGLNFRSVKPNFNYTIGLVAQPSLLEGQDLGRHINTSRKNFNWIPTARFVYNFSRSNNLAITYGGASREPSFNQLQPVSDDSNLQNIIVGNPDLNSEFTNRLSLRYSKFDRTSGNSLFTNLSFDQTNNKIVTNRINDSKGTGRTTRYLNTDGFYGINGNISYTKPFAERKYTVTVNANANYDNNISFTDNQKNKGQNWLIQPGARFRIDLENIIDADLNASYAIYKTSTRYASRNLTTTNEAQTLIMGLNGKNYFFKDWTFGYDFSKVLNYGYKSGRTNPTIVNVFMERRFLKGNRGTLRLQGFDLFNENTGISRDINGTTITDSQNNRLARYFLLSFNLRLQKFAGASFQRGGQNNNRMRGGMQGGGGRTGGGGGFRRN